MSTFTPLEDLAEYELLPGVINPLMFTVLGAGDFVLGRVRRLIASVERGEVVYLVVNTGVSNYRDAKGEERLVPVAWTDFLPHRRQVRLPQLSPVGFRHLPLYHPGGTIPAQIDFPKPLPDEVAYWDALG